MTLDGHEDWVRWGRNRVGLWGRHAAWGWGWMRFVGVFWWLEGVSNQQFFFPHGCKTRSWIAHISHIHDVQRMPQVVHCLSEKDTPQRTCVIKCDGCTILMIWHLYTHYIWCIHIYISMYMPTKRIHLICHLHGWKTAGKIVEHAPRRTANFSPDGGGTWFSWSLTLMVQKSGEETTFWILLDV